MDIGILRNVGYVIQQIHVYIAKNDKNHVFRHTKGAAKNIWKRWPTQATNL